MSPAQTSAYQQSKGGSSQTTATPGSSANEDKTPGSSQQVMIERGSPDTERGARGRYDYAQNPAPDRTSSVRDMMQWFAGLRGDDLIRLQDQLEAAGLLPSHSEHPGAYGRGIAGDYVTGQAYQSLLGQAIFTKQTIDETLASRTAANQKYGNTAGAAGAARQGEIVSLTDPGTIKTMADKLIPNVIGRKLTDAELNAAVSLYHAAEKAHADAAYVAQGSGGPGGPGGTLTDVQDLSSFLESEAQRLHPTEYAQQGELNTLGGVASMISGGKPSL